MAARREITRKFAREYKGASKKHKGQVLTDLCAATNWSRANARRQIHNVLARRRGAGAKMPRTPRPRGFSYDALVVLIEVWDLSGRPCGKYLAAIMADTVDRLVAHHELRRSGDRLTPAVRAELEAMSPATIDRYLRPTKTRLDPTARSATRAGETLRSTISVRKAGDAMQAAPGFLEIDLVAHCGHSLRGEFAWTLTATDVFTGWTVNVAIRNRASVHVIAAMTQVVDSLPFTVKAIDFDNGGEFVNHDFLAWCEHRGYAVTRARPYRHNDNAHVEQKNGAVVRRNAYRWRYETPAELQLLNRLWPLVNLRKNHLLPTRKAIGWTSDSTGRKKRVYDTPATPYTRLLASGAILPDRADNLAALHARLNPAELDRRIKAIQRGLIITGRARSGLDATPAIS